MAARKPPQDEFIFRTSSELINLLANGNGKPFGRPLQEIMADLVKPVPFELISWQPGKMNNRSGKQSPPIPYLAWTDVELLLDYYAPGWESNCQDGQLISGSGKGQYTILFTLSIHAAEGKFTRTNAGWDQDIDDSNFGGPVPDAHAVGKRRAAASWGLFRYAYNPEHLTQLWKELKSRGWYDKAQEKYSTLNKDIGNGSLLPPLPPPPNSQLVEEGTISPILPVPQFPEFSIQQPAPQPEPVLVPGATTLEEFKQAFKQQCKQVGYDPAAHWNSHYKNGPNPMFKGKTFDKLTLDEARLAVQLLDIPF